MASLRLAGASLVMLCMITATHSYDIHSWDHPLQGSDVLSPIDMYEFLERPSQRTVCGCGGAPKQAQDDAHHGNTMNVILDELQRLEREVALPRNQQSLQLVQPQPLQLHGCKEEAHERRTKEAHVHMVSKAVEQALAAGHCQLVGEAHHRQKLAMEDHYRSEDRRLVAQEQFKLAAAESRRLAALEQHRLAAEEQHKLVEEEQRRLAALEQQMAARHWPVVQQATNDADVDADIDYDELLRETLQDAPVKTRGERAEWNLRTGWGRKEDAGLRWRIPEGIKG